MNDFEYHLDQQSNDWDHRLVYSDWLLEHGDDNASAIQRAIVKHALHLAKVGDIWQSECKFGLRITGLRGSMRHVASGDLREITFSTLNVFDRHGTLEWDGIFDCFADSHHDLLRNGVWAVQFHFANCWLDGALLVDHVAETGSAILRRCAYGGTGPVVAKSSIRTDLEHLVVQLKTESPIHMDANHASDELVI